MANITRTFLILIISFFCFSCNQNNQSKKYTIGFSQCTGGDSWRRQMLLAMKGELAFYPEIGFEYKDAEYNSDKQIKDIEELIRQKVDVLIVSPNEAEPITPVVERAYQSGIPVIVVDRKTNSGIYSAFVGADNYEIGKLAGEYAANILQGKGSILEIWGLRGSSPAIDRHRGFIQALSKYPAIKIIGEVDGKFEPDTTKVNLKKTIDKLPDFNLVFAQNDVMAYAAQLICKEARPNQKIDIIGIDALPGPDAGIQFVNDKILTATFLYPTGGEEAIRIAKQILTNQPYEKENILNTTMVDAKNVRVMKLQSDKILTQQKDIVRQQEKINEQIRTYYSQRILIYILLASLIITVIVGAMAIIAWRAKNEINIRLQVKNDEILTQRNTIAAMAEKAEAATNEKLKFFTNISHEFKTPLTLIMGPIDELLSRASDAKSPEAKENLLLIKKNATRLLRLVNQLMDFRKIEDKKMILRASERDLIQFITEVMSAFEKIARKRKIDFQLKTEVNQLYVWFDPEMLDKVIFNLLSNAFKFTNDKGWIYISISIDSLNKNVVIIVEDNGTGMSAELATHAFDPFYTGENVTGGGTGIGLSLSKEFIDLHQGELVLTSEKGKGTRFSISLPLGKAHFEEQQIIPTNIEWIRNQNFDIIHETDVVSKEDSEMIIQRDYTILLIDDNKELRQFVKNRLESTYNIVEAHDGVTALHLAFEVVPDLIICDVMLPGKDGFEVCKDLKEDVRTSHIPIIILTAKGSVEQKITGIQTGADEYLTKPFAFEYLIERIKALIRTRNKLKEHFSQDLNVEPQHATPGGLDKKFINDFGAVVEKNIGNVDFNVNDMARELGMSRVQVYRKVKALLGYSVNDYIVNARLKKAKYLLINTDKTISEVSADVGFSSANYFSTAFKNKFHLSPKEFKTAQSA
ncbi:MAG TPA: substrate-binding domain-containing protein [Cyclobacteriaceae bacterium]